MLMKQLNQLSEWIAESKPAIRKREVKAIQSIDSNELAYKLAIGLQPAIINYIQLTATAVSIGKSVLIHLENAESTERTLAISRLKVGYHLLNILFEKDIIKLSNRDKDRDQYQIEVIDNDWIDGLFYSIDVEMINVATYLRPSLVKPEPFTNFYHPVVGPMVRRAHTDARKEFNPIKCPKVFQVINNQMSVAYNVNTDLLEIYDACKNDDLFTLKGKELNKKQKEGILREMNQTQNIAESFAGETFYEYMHYDTRGRLYSTNAYFKHDGSKLSKSLFLLNERKELGTEGWFWLLIHAVNCFGEDKLSLDDKFDFAEKNLEEWLKIAENPVINKDWQYVDDPFGFLAAIRDIWRAFNSPDRYLYRSGIIVALDASCSGLQVLSAMGRDENSGALCNLTDTDVRGDFYEAVSKEIIWEDNEFWAQEKFVKYRRKLCKRPCMVLLYSAQPRTMARSLLSDFSSEPDFAGLNWENALWLTQNIYDSCYKVLDKPCKLMDLFIDFGLSAYKKDKDYSFKAPLTGFTMQQYYRKDVSELIKVLYKGKRVRLRLITGKNDKLDYHKIKSSTSPNVVHCLDSQIVAGVSLATEYDISMIHDSFGCSAADAGKLFEDTRSVFHNIFSEDVLETLYEQSELENDFEYGNLEINEVLSNEFCFS